jgi:hypothetical protein
MGVELILEIRDAEEGGYCARALGERSVVFWLGVSKSRGAMVNGEALRDRPDALSQLV